MVKNESETYTALREITTGKQKKTKKDKKNNKRETEKSKSDKVTLESEIFSSTKKEEVKQANVSEANKAVQKTTENKTADSAASKDYQKTTVPKHVPIPFVKATEKATKKATQTTVKKAETTKKSSEKVYPDETVSEVRSGLNIVFASDSVEKGNTASVMIQGTPNKTYTLKFYTHPNSTTDFVEAEELTADENGFVSWTFRVPMNTESGNRKIVIEEKGSSNIIQTSIKIR